MILQEQNRLTLRVVRATRMLALGALFLGAPLLNIAHADSVMGNQVMAAPPTALRAAADLQSDAAPTSEFIQLLQDLSPLPVLALGLLGLIWIRRHTTDL